MSPDIDLTGQLDCSPCPAGWLLSAARWPARLVLERVFEHHAVSGHEFGHFLGRLGRGWRDVRRGRPAALSVLPVRLASVRRTRPSVAVTSAVSLCRRLMLSAIRHGPRRAVCAGSTAGDTRLGWVESAEPNLVPPIAVATTESWWPMPCGPSLHPLMPAGLPARGARLPGLAAGPRPLMISQCTGLVPALPYRSWGSNPEPAD